MHADRPQPEAARPRRFTDPRIWLICGLVIFALLPAFSMWNWVSHHWVPLPFWDEWHTPGSQLESWYRGTLTWKEMFSQHSESRKFFPRLLYFALQYFDGWDVRHEMRVEFFLVCGFSLLLLFLLRRTRGASLVTALNGWIAMNLVCFAPVQLENFLYGIQIETFFPGFALLAAAALNLSALSYRSKTLLNLALAFIATYTFANGMLVWALAWPLPAPNDSMPLRKRYLWLALYFAAAVASVGAYFVGYHRPSYHPPFASVFSKFVDLAHYIILWSGNYFATDFVGPFVLGIVALSLFFVAAACALWTIWRGGNWRTFYPWLLLGAFAGVTVTTTALGRLGFGVDQALSNRYVAFSLFFYIALFGLCFALYCAQVRTAPPARRALFITNLAWVLGFFAALWASSYQKNLGVATEQREVRTHLLRTLEWIDPIPDNPDLKLILPFPELLRARARYLEEQHVLRLPFVHGALAAAVREAPPPTADATYGNLELAVLKDDQQLHLQGWAWLPKRKRPADCVVIGAENSAGAFKPLTVLTTGQRRPDVRAAKNSPHAYRTGFDYSVGIENLPAGEMTIKGWAIDLHAQKAWPLASAVTLPAR